MQITFGVLMQIYINTSLHRKDQKRANANNSHPDQMTQETKGRHKK